MSRYLFYPLLWVIAIAVGLIVKGLDTADRQQARRKQKYGKHRPHQTCNQNHGTGQG